MGGVLRLRVISINDVYTLDNLPRLKSLVDHHLTTDPADATVLAIAGDFVAPTILSALDGGHGIVDCLNALGVAYASLGNHENDIPPAELHRRVREFRGTWLSTNVEFDAAMPRSATRDVERSGRRVRVGLIGIVMNDPFVIRGAPFGGSPMLPPQPTALEEAGRLIREVGCDCVIAMTHQPIADDRTLAFAAATAGISLPLIVGGHEHVPLLDNVANTWIVKSGTDAAAACITDLVWPETAGERPPAPVVAVAREPVAGYREDASVRTLVDLHMRAVHQLGDRTLVSIPPGQVLTSIGARAAQTSLGTLLCSRLRDALHADVGLINGGGLRGSHEYRGGLTYADLAREIPFTNEVVVAAIPGGVLRDAVAVSRARAPAEYGGFLQVDDRVTLDGVTITAIAGVPLDLQRAYRVALVRDLFTGLDDIEPLVQFANQHPAKIPPPTAGRDIKHFLVEAFSRELA